MKYRPTCLPIPFSNTTNPTLRLTDSGLLFTTQSFPSRVQLHQFLAALRLYGKVRLLCHGNILWWFDLNFVLDPCWRTIQDGLSPHNSPIVGVPSHWISNTPPPGLHIGFHCQFCPCRQKCQQFSYRGADRSRRETTPQTVKKYDGSHEKSPEILSEYEIFVQVVICGYTFDHSWGCSCQCGTRYSL